MSFNLVFLNPTGGVATPFDRKNDCITLTPMQAGSLSTFSVTVKNTGDAECPLVTAEFFLERPTDSGPVALASNLCLPAANPPPPTSLAVNASVVFTLQYTVQNGDVGAGTVYAQIQSVSPPPANPHPEDMSQIFNAKCNVVVIAAAVGVGPKKPSLDRVVV